MAAETIVSGGITGYVQPGGKTVAGSKTTWQVVVDKGQGETFLAGFSDGAQYSSYGGYFVKDESSCAAGFFDTVTLVFSASRMIVYPGSGTLVKTSYAISANVLEKPLEDHANYRTKWNYNLYGFTNDAGVAPNIPGWAASATTTEGADGNTYMWAKSQPARSDKGYWKCLVPCTKPGVESYIFPQPVVTVKKYYRKESDMEAAFRKIALREAPPKFATLAAAWLITNCQPVKEGSYWVVELEYSGADAWDTDIYEAAT